MEQGERPYSQPNYKNIKLEGLCGKAYKFQITFPMSENSRQIFSDEHKAKLVDLLTQDFDGCTLTDDVTHPLLKGTYKDKDGNILKGKHSQIMVYTCQDDVCIDYFENLQETLKKVSGEDEILIEMNTVLLVGKKTTGEIMGINENIFKEIKEEINKEMKETPIINEESDIADLEKFCLNYLRNLNPIDLANKHGFSLDESTNAIELLQRSDELRKLASML